MTDDAAHTPSGSIAGSFAAEGAGGLSHEAGFERPAEAITPAASDEIVTAPGRDVELVGRQTTRAERVPERELVAVGAGAAEGAAAPASGEPSAPSVPSPDPAVDVVDDAPHWSFRDQSPVAPPDFPIAGDTRGDQGELPLAMAAAPVAAPPRPMPMFGPVGRLRSPIAVVLLSIVSLGAYAIGWHRTVNREMELFDPKLHARPGRSMLAVLLPWLIGLLVSVAGAVLVVTARLGVQIPFDTHLTATQAYYLLGGLAAVPYLTLIIPFSLVAVVMTLERLRAVEEHVGATTDRQVRPVGTALLLLVPVFGGLALLAIEQRRLNAVWQSVTPAGYPYS